MSDRLVTRAHIATSPAKPAAALRIALIVPTYRRPAELRRCLAAIEHQQRRPDQVLVIVRDDDAPTHAVVRQADPEHVWLTLVTVSTPGVVAALNAGLRSADADVIAFTDDDAAPQAEWLKRIEGRFMADPRVGGVGGRDWVYQHGRLESESRAVVGRISWLGRCIGNHHLGVGPCRDVDALKGVNMAFRARALQGVQFDTRLRGSGAQVCNELGVSLAVKRRGWRLVYDPQIAVDHFPSARHDEDQRNTFCVEAIGNAIFNETLLLCEHFGPWRRRAFIAWALTIGHRAAPGILQWLRLSVTEPRTATRRFRASWAARLSGWRAAR